MKFIKILIEILVVIMVLGGANAILDKVYKDSVSSCIEAGHTQTFCEYHAAK